jgi:hypothetical protein
MISAAVRRIITGGSVSPQAQAFLQRTTGLGGAYRSASVKLINGLVADGIWPKLDALWIFATQDETTAQLNLVSSSFAATLSGAPTFAPGIGYTGLASANNCVLLPSFSGYTQFQRNSCSLSIWEYYSRAGSALSQVDQNGIGWLVTRNASDQFTGNIAEALGTMAASNTNSQGHFMGIRTGTNAEALYQNGAQVATGSQASVAIGAGTAKVPHSTSTSTISMARVGGDITAQAAQFYSRIRAYMSAVGAP